MNMAGSTDKKEERTAGVIDSFKFCVEKWIERKGTLFSLQSKVNVYLNKTHGDPKLQIGIVYYAIIAIPKAIKTPAFIFIEDVEWLCNIFLSSCDAPGVTLQQKRDARDNIMFIFREGFARVLAEQTSADDSRVDSYDDAALNVSKDVYPLYKNNLKRKITRILERDSKKMDDDTQKTGTDDVDETNQDEEQLD